MLTKVSKAIILIAAILFITPENKLWADTAEMASIKKDLKEKSITKVKVIYLPYDTASFVRITPDALSNNSSAKVFIVKCTEDLRTNLLHALENTTILATNKQGDMRWGAMLYDKAGKVRHSIYLDRRYSNLVGNFASIDGDDVFVNELLIEWFEKYFMPKT